MANRPVSILPVVTGLALALAGCFGGSFEGGSGGAGNGNGDGAGAGDGDGDGDEDVAPGAPDAAPDAPPLADYALALAPLSAELVLGETKTFAITIEGTNGFSGPVTLAAPGMPTTWQLSFDPATVDVTAGQSATATLTLVIPTDAEIAASTLTVTATATPGARQASPADILVKPEVVIRIPAGSVDNPDDAFGPGGETRVRYLAPGTKVTWVNDDVVNHRIHADDVNGIQHQGGEIAPGASYSDTIEDVGIIEYNCHIHGQMRGRLVVMAGP